MGQMDTAAHLLHAVRPNPDRSMIIRWMARVCVGIICTLLLFIIGAAAVVAASDAGPSSSLIPATHLSGAVCVVSGTNANPSNPGMTPFPLSPHPSGVVVVWLPGLNSKACKAVLTRGNAHIASVLASGLDQAMMVQRGVHSGPILSCPNDNGTTARLYFTYAHRPTQRIDLDLSGCGSISLLKVDSQRPSSGGHEALAPKAWRAYVAPHPDISAEGHVAVRPRWLGDVGGEATGTVQRRLGALSNS